MKEPHYFSRIEPSPERARLLPARERRGRLPGPVRRRCGRGAGRRGEHLLPVGRRGRRADPAIVVPEASILIMLRDPVERAYSQYWNDVREGLEKRSFPDALAEERRSGPGAMGRDLPLHRLWPLRGPGGEVPGRVRSRAGPRLVFRGLRRRQARHDGGHPSFLGVEPAAARRSAAPHEPHLDAPEPARRGAPRERQGADTRSGHGPATALRGRLRGALLKEVGAVRRWTPRRASPLERGLPSGRRAAGRAARQGSAVGALVAGGSADRLGEGAAAVV